MTSAPCCVFTSVVTVVGKSFTSPVMTTRSFRHLSCGRLSSSSPLRIDLPKPPLLCCRHIILSHRGRSQILPSCSRLRPLLLSKCCYKCLSLGSTFTRSLIYTKLLRRRRSFRNLIEGGGGGARRTRARNGISHKFKPPDSVGRTKNRPNDGGSIICGVVRAPMAGVPPYWIRVFRDGWIFVCLSFTPTRSFTLTSWPKWRGCIPHLRTNQTKRRRR